MGCKRLTYRNTESPLRVVYKKSCMNENIVQRFLSVDPLASKYPSISPYAYVMNNPLRFTDPTGMEVEDIIIRNKNEEELGRIVLPGVDTYIDLETDVSVDNSLVIDPRNLGVNIETDAVDAIGISVEGSGVFGGGLFGSIDVVHFLDGEDKGDTYLYGSYGGAAGVDGEFGMSGFVSSFNTEGNADFFSAKGMEGRFQGYSAGMFVSVSYSWSNEKNNFELFPNSATKTWERINIAGGFGGGEIGAKLFFGVSEIIRKF